MTRGSKYPPTTFTFWMATIVAAIAGLAGGDALSDASTGGWAIADVATAAAMSIAVTAHLLVPRYVSAIYWLAFVLTSATSAIASRSIVHAAGSHGATLMMALVLVTLLTLAASVAIGGASNAIARRTGTRAEVSHWVGLFVASAAGYLFAELASTGVGAQRTGLLFGAMLAVVVLTFRQTSVSRRGLFWVAFVLTRPFGASVVDLLTASRSQGGFEVDPLLCAGSALALLVAIVSTTSLRWGADRQGTSDLRTDEVHPV